LGIRNCKGNKRFLEKPFPKLVGAAVLSSKQRTSPATSTKTNGAETALTSAAIGADATVAEAEGAEAERTAAAGADVEPKGAEVWTPPDFTWTSLTLLEKSKG
jgi:hypothetical protein